jgi:hypothetical protein
MTQPALAVTVKRKNDTNKRRDKSKYLLAFMGPSPVIMKLDLCGVVFIYTRL